MSTLLNYAKPSRAARWAARRRGSVLILCVVLIVVLALIGTAMLSTARIDRFTATQHGDNIQIELLMEGARQIAQSVILGDIYGVDSSGVSFYRPADTSNGGTPTTSYDHWDGLTLTDASTLPLQNDGWLAPLTPSMLVRETSPGPPPEFEPASAIYWPAITRALVGSDFEDPLTQMSIADETNAFYMAPTVKDNNPALARIVASTGAFGNPITAGDADGDGIADSLACRLVPGEINGVRYYVYYRIIDNGGKINLNTAWSRASDFVWPAGPPQPVPDRVAMFDSATVLGAGSFAANLGMFASHVGLMELLRRSDAGTPSFADTNAWAEMREINRVRFGLDGTGTQDFAASLVAYDDPNIPPNPNPDPVPRMDMEFVTVGDLLEHQLARRLAHAGTGEFVVAGNPPEDRRFGRFETSDAGALAYHFVLSNPESSLSKVEETFFDAYRQTGAGTFTAYGPDSLVRSAANFVKPAGQQASPIVGQKSYNASGEHVALWYDQNFNWHRAFSGANVPVPGAGSYPLILDGTASGVPSDYLPWSRPLRPVVTTFNPVSNQIPARSTTTVPPGTAPTVPPGMAPYRFPGTPAPGVPVKTNVNTAGFEELWRAYWCVMYENTDTGTPFTSVDTNWAGMIYNGNHFDGLHNPVAEDHPMQMFRSPLRDMHDPQSVFIPPDQVLILRAAIAAANTIDLRDPDSDPTRVNIALQGSVVDGEPPVGLTVNVYGMEPQPYITEIYVNTDNTNPNNGLGPNPKGYVAVELYNPYPVDISIEGWGLAVLDRRPPIESAPPPVVNTYPGTSPSGSKGLSYFYIHNGGMDTTDGGDLTGPTTFPVGQGFIVPARGFLVLHNMIDAGGDVGENNAQAQPAGMPSPPPNAKFVPNLHWVIQDIKAAADAFKEGRGGELVLLRPAGAGALRIETGNAIPVDSFDFTGLISGDRYRELAGPTDPTTFTGWHYRRSNETAGQPNWKFVYPGRYSGDISFKQRQQGTNESFWEDPGQDPDISNQNLGAADAGATYPTVHTIQVANVGFPGPFPIQALNNQFPFGGFARNGDILQVTFIGSYRVAFADDNSSTLELNSITMDSCFANDTDAYNPTITTVPNGNDERPADASSMGIMESREQVGRFAPIHDPAGTYNDLDDTGSYDTMAAAATNKWRYRWCLDLFDYLTVNSPSHDFLPNVRPGATNPYQALGNPEPQAVKNSNKAPAANDMPPPPPGTLGSEDAIPVHGLININTAPWWVLSAIPWVRGSHPPASADLYSFDDVSGQFDVTGPNGVDDNIDIAKAIVRYRDGNPAAGPIPALTPGGPFKSIFDLYKVPTDPYATPATRVSLFSAIQAAIGVAAEPDDDQGDFSPYNLTPVPPTPTTDGVRDDFEEQFLILNRVSNLITTRSDSYTVYILVEGYRGQDKVVQRRAAFIFDRSAVSPANPQPDQPINVPND